MEDACTTHMVIHIDPKGPVSRLASLKPGECQSRLMSEAAQRYLDPIRLSMPDFTGPEWMAVFDALGAEWVVDEFHAAVMVGWIMEGVDMFIEDAELTLDRERISRILFQQPFAGLMAVMVLNDLFWSRGNGVEVNTVMEYGPMFLLTPDDEEDC